MGRFRPSNSLELRWGDSTADLGPVPREALVPLDGSFPPLRIAFWLGAAGHLGGANGHLEVPLAHARIVPIALSVLTLLMMIAIGRRLDPGGLSPWFGALLWAALPWIALQTRVVKEESLLTTLAVGSVLAFLRWRDDGQRNRDLVLAAVLAGLCPLTKVTGAAFIIALLILVAAEGSHNAMKNAQIERVRESASRSVGLPASR